MLPALLLYPSATDPSRLDVVLIECMLGIDRFRPEAVVKLGTRRMVAPPSGESSSKDPPAAPPRQPTNLEGELAVDGMHSVRLDEFARYGELLGHAGNRLEWAPEEFRGYRVRSTYPLIGKKDRGGDRGHGVFTRSSRRERSRRGRNQPETVQSCKTVSS